MPVTADEVLAEAAAMCGDRNQTLYTDDKLLPLLKRAARDLQITLSVYGSNAVEGEHVSATVAAGILEHPDPPNDLLVPIKLWERPDSSTSDLDWTPMDERDWDPFEGQESTLGVWKHQNEKIKFRGATVATKVKMLYRKALLAITSVGSAITIPDSENFLAAKTASYAARFIGKNPSLGGELNGEAQQALDLLLSVRVRENQNEVLRMKPYSMNRRRG